MAKKSLTAEQVQAKKDKAVQFLRDVKGDDDLADEFEGMDLGEYADHKGITIVNQEKRSLKMPNGNGDPRTKAELLDEIGELQSQLDAINDILNPPPEDDDDDTDDDNQD